MMIKKVAQFNVPQFILFALVVGATLGLCLFSVMLRSALITTYLPEYIAMIVLVIALWLFVLKYALKYALKYSVDKNQWNTLTQFFIGFLGGFSALLLLMLILEREFYPLDYFFSKAQFEILLGTLVSLQLLFGYYLGVWKTLFISIIPATFLLALFARYDSIYSENSVYGLLLLLLALAIVPIVICNPLPRSLHDSSAQKNTKKYVTNIPIIGVLLLTIIGFWIRVRNLSITSIFHDEAWLFSSGVGYLHTGTFRLWDFVNSATADIQFRAFELTWLIAQSFKLFGVNEFAARLPIVLIGTLSLPVFYSIFKYFTQKYIALIATFIATFSIPMVFYSRFIRGYALLMIEYTILLFLGYKLIELLLPLKKEHIQWKKILLLFISFFSVALLAYENQPIILNIIPVLFIFTLFKTVLQIKVQKRFFVTGVRYIFGILGAVTAIILLYITLKPYLPISNPALDLLLNGELITILNAPHIEYLNVFLDIPYRSGILTTITALIGTIALWKHDHKKGLYISLALWIPGVLSIFVWGRYVDERYVSFLHPLVILVIAAGIEWTVMTIIQHFPKKKFHILYVTTISGLLIIAIAPPGIPYIHNDPILPKAVSDWSTTDPVQLNKRHVAPLFRETFDVINENAQKGDIIVGTSAAYGWFNYLKTPNNYIIYALPQQNSVLEPLNSGAKDDTDLLKLIDSENRPGLWIIPVYVHQLSPLILEKLQSLSGSEYDVSTDVKGSYIFNYNEIYQDLFHFPSLYYFPPTQ